MDWVWSGFQMDLFFFQPDLEWIGFRKQPDFDPWQNRYLVNGLQIFFEWIQIFVWRKQICVWGKQIFVWRKQIFVWGKQIFVWRKQIFVFFVWGKQICFLVMNLWVISNSNWILWSQSFDDMTNHTEASRGANPLDYGGWGSYFRTFEINGRDCSNTQLGLLQLKKDVCLRKSSPKTKDYKFVFEKKLSL